METHLNLTIYNENGEKQKPTSITVSGLLGGEDPQTEFKGAAAMLPVEPLSKAATMQIDVSRDIWRQKTSENVNFKSYFMETDLSYLLNKEIRFEFDLKRICERWQWTFGWYPFCLRIVHLHLLIL